MPFANYKDFADCVAKNTGKVSDPKAYCAVIQRRAEKGMSEIFKNEILMQLGEIAEDNTLRGAQLMPLGKWRHPLGPIEMTPERARKFEAQFRRGVVGQKQPIFFIHSDKANVSNPNYGKAAGWITDLRADDERGVLIDISFTEAGAKSVRQKEYLYLSAEYFDKVQLPHRDGPEEDVIMAASLVNRPHLKGMEPILNEETGHLFLSDVEKDPKQGGGPVDPILQRLCKAAKISLSEDQIELTEEQQTKLAEFLDGRDKALSDVQAQATLLQQQLDEVDGGQGQKIRTLREAGFDDEAKLLEEYRADRMVMQLEEFVPDGADLSKAGKDAAKAYALEQTPENLEKLHELMLSGAAIAKMEPKGTATEGDTTEGDAAAQILEEANKLSQEKKISLTDAMVEVSKANPALWNEYQDEVGSKWAKAEVS